MVIKSFKLFESNSDINVICKKYNIRNYTIENGFVNVDGDVVLSHKNLTKIPLKFGHINDNFYCSSNQLTSLEGCPTSIGGNFICYYNQLISLKECPESIGGDFYCNDNQLTSLEGCPESIGGGFYCSYNQLTSLKGCPQTIGEDFYCNDNQLTSLEGCPESIGGDFYCNDNQIKDFGNRPIRFRNLICSGNPIEEIYTLNPCKEFIEYLIEYQVIRDGNNIIKQRLIQALEDSNWMELDFELSEYTII